MGGLPTVQGRKGRQCTYRMSLSNTGMQDTEPWAYVPEAQGLRKRKGEPSHKPSS